MRTLGVAALLAALVAPGLLAWLWSRPYAATPRELPPLTLPPHLVAAQLEADRRDAGEAPTGPLAERRLELYRQTHRAEVAGAERREDALRRRQALREALAGLTEAHGEGARSRARAADLARAERALEGGAGAPDAVDAYGGLASAMRRYSMLEGDRQLAPRFVVRTTFKARWNTAHGRPLTEGLSRVELRAYWGWLVLRADAAPTDLRLEGVDAYRDAGGEGADEARGFLLYSEGRPAAARAAYERAYGDQPTFKIRNVLYGLEI